MLWIVFCCKGLTIVYYWIAVFQSVNNEIGIESDEKTAYCQYQSRAGNQFVQDLVKCFLLFLILPMIRVNKKG